MLELKILCVMWFFGALLCSYWPTFLFWFKINNMNKNKWKTAALFLVSWPVQVVNYLKVISEAKNEQPEEVYQYDPSASFPPLREIKTDYQEKPKTKKKNTKKKQSKPTPKKLTVKSATVATNTTKTKKNTKKPIKKNSPKK